MNRTSQFGDVMEVWQQCVAQKFHDTIKDECLCWLKCDDMGLFGDSRREGGWPPMAVAGILIIGVGCGVILMLIWLAEKNGVLFRPDKEDMEDCFAKVRGLFSR
jgi:hypothetical protein